MDGQDHTDDEPVNARIFPVPPAVAALFIAAGWALNRVIPIGETGGAAPLESRLAGGAIVLCAVAIAAFGLAEIRRMKTDFHPGGSASALVSSGVYSRTRNPMYLAMALIAIGLGVATVNAWMVLMGPLLLIYLQERVVKREETYLLKRFGADYAAYRSKVRRWF